MGQNLGREKNSHNVPSVPLTSHTLTNSGRINIPSQSRFNEQHEENICLWPWSWCLTAWKRLLRLEQQHTISDTKGHEHDSTDGSPSSQGKYSHSKKKKIHRASQQQLDNWSWAKHSSSCEIHAGCVFTKKYTSREPLQQYLLQNQ